MNKEGKVLGYCYRYTIEEPAFFLEMTEVEHVRDTTYSAVAYYAKFDENTKKLSGGTTGPLTIDLKHYE